MELAQAGRVAVGVHMRSTGVKPRTTTGKRKPGQLHIHMVAWGHIPAHLSKESEIPPLNRAQQVVTKVHVVGEEASGLLLDGLLAWHVPCWSFTALHVLFHLRT